jgi:hypothetical protein
MPITTSSTITISAPESIPDEVPVNPDAIYIAPVGASYPDPRDGTITNPYTSVAAALATGTVVGGDELYLMDGLHDRLYFSGVSFTTPIVIKSQNSKAAWVNTVYCQNSSAGITFEDLTIYRAEGSFGNLWEDDSGRSCSRMTVKNCKIQSRLDVSGYFSWSAAQWAANTNIGIFFWGSDHIAEDNDVHVTSIGMVNIGTRCINRRNLVHDFCNDGTRFGGTDSEFYGNIVKNGFVIDANHPDMMQYGGVRLVIDANQFIEWDYAESHPFHLSYQGVCCYDGTNPDITITNNLIRTSVLVHGITLVGASGSSLVANNTLIATPDNAPSNYVNINIGTSNQGNTSSGVTCINNIARGYSFVAGAVSDQANNVTMLGTDYNAQFQSHTWTNYDYHLRSGSALLTGGRTSGAPTLDLDGVTRTAPVSQGCYELIA